MQGITRTQVIPSVIYDPNTDYSARPTPQGEVEVRFTLEDASQLVTLIERYEPNGHSTAELALRLAIHRAV